MPELPEVQTVVDEMQRRMRGDRVVGCMLARPDYVRTPTPDLAAALVGRRILDVTRQGKRIWLSLSAVDAAARDATIAARCRFHLGMSGRITFERVDAPIEPHTHLRLRLRRHERELRFCDARRFGGIWFYNGEASVEADSETPLGPDAMTISTDALASLCQRRRPIKSLLMDQHLISGLGNIYCDEALFEARIHPLRPAERLQPGEIHRLARGIRAVLRRALAHGGSTLRDYVRTDGREGEFQRLHRVYDREGRPCPRCRRPIGRMILGGRSSHFCPGCQALPRGVRPRTRAHKQ